jgi:DNA-binding NarL/FixJ family response regulator
VGDGRVVSVVIADDDAAMRSALVELMESDATISVKGVAENADQTVALVREHMPNVLLLDLRMPGGGKDAARSTKQLAPATRIVVLTAQDDLASRRVMGGEGAERYLVKGVPGEEILDAVLDR